MNAIIREAVDSLSVPIAYAYGARRFYSQEFVSVTNLLGYDPRFVKKVVGTYILSPGTPFLADTGDIDLTGEFYFDSKTGESIPMWYGQILRKPVERKSIAQKVLTKTYQGQVASFQNVKERLSDIIVSDTVVVTVDAQVQALSAVYIDHAVGAFYVDLSQLPNVPHDITIHYEVITLDVEFTEVLGSTALRARDYGHGSYIVTVLYSRTTGGVVRYKSSGAYLNEPVQADLLYRKTQRGLVVNDSYTFAYDQTGLVLPSTRTFQNFALRPRVESGTVVTFQPPLGLAIGQPWFVRVVGKPPSGVSIPEIESSARTIEDRKEIAVVADRTKLAVSGKSLVVTTDSDGNLGGISATSLDGKQDIPIQSVNSLDGIINTSVELPFDAQIEVAYKEEVTWFEYEKLQLNPSLENDPTEILSNFAIIYIGPVVNNESIGHFLVPRAVDGKFKMYTYEEIKALCEARVPGSIPAAIVQVIESVNENYYDFTDLRARGGYGSQSAYITDRITWDGEDVDISGNVVVKVPKALVAEITARELLWNKLLTPGQAQDIATTKIKDAIEMHRRRGMKFHEVWEI